MARINLTKDEERDIKAALAGLTAAQSRAMSSGKPFTVVVNGELIRQDAEGRITVLKSIPRVKASVSSKQSRHRER